MIIQENDYFNYSLIENKTIKNNFIDKMLQIIYLIGYCQKYEGISLK